jgi:acyl-CoA thioester hydrolase
MTMANILMPDGGRLVHEESVQSTWVDYNGHMNVAYYILVFDHGTDALFELLDMGPDYRARTESSNFVVESHICYIREVVEGDPLQVASILLMHDNKRMHLFHHMYNGETGQLCATIELMTVHVDMISRHSSFFLEETLLNLRNYIKDQATFRYPEQAGSVIGIKAR